MITFKTTLGSAQVDETKISEVIDMTWQKGYTCLRLSDGTSIIVNESITKVRRAITEFLHRP